MEKPSVILRFLNTEKFQRLPRVPVAGDWVSLHDEEYLVAKVILEVSSRAIVVIDTECRKEDAELIENIEVRYP